MRLPALALLLCVATRGVASEEAAIDYPAALPPEAHVRAVMMASPRIVAAQEEISMGLATQRRRAAGPYEWDISAQAQRRKDPLGLVYNEQEYGLSRRFRIPGKGILDRSIGRQSAANGEAAYEDAWHEAGRDLLSGWFDWLRAERALALQREQLVLLKSQQDAVEKRVAAGDAPRLEQLLAATELDRAVAAEIVATADARTHRQELLRHFPTLNLELPAMEVAPAAVEGDDRQWVERVIGHNHEIELAEGRAESARLEARRAARDRIADPNLGVTYTNNLDGNRNVTGLRFSMPLGGALRRADLALARSQANVAAAMAQAARQGVTTDAENDVIAARSRHAAWQKLSGAAAQSRQNADTVQRGYALGEFGIAELLSARRQSLETVLAAETARLDAQQAYARLMLDAHLLWTPDHPMEHATR